MVAANKPFSEVGVEFATVTAMPCGNGMSRDANIQSQLQNFASDFGAVTNAAQFDDLV
jgi:hypothetical protein